MIYGRVIGNELRDVPPEYLPIWGQRWSGYRAPHGPSPFSTRIFSVDQMSEIGPALTSPSQFKVMLTEEDEGDDGNSEPSRLYSSFPSPPTVQTDTSNLISRSERPTPNSVHPSSSHSHSSHAPELLSHPPAFHHGILIEGGRALFESDYIPWDMGRASTRNQPRVDPSQRSHVSFGDASTQSRTYSFHITGSDYLVQQFQADDRTSFIPTTKPSSSHRFTIPPPQQAVVADSSSNRELSITMAPGIAHPRNPMVAEWQSVVPPDPHFLGLLQNSGSSLGPGTSYHLVSDYYTDSSHLEDPHSTYAEGCTLVSLDRPGGGQFTHMIGR